MNNGVYVSDNTCKLNIHNMNHLRRVGSRKHVLWMPCGRLDLTCLNEDAISAMPLCLPRSMTLCECTFTCTVLLDKRAPHIGESMGHVSAFSRYEDGHKQ